MIIKDVLCLLVLQILYELRFLNLCVNVRKLKFELW